MSEIDLSEKEQKHDGEIENRQESSHDRMIDKSDPILGLGENPVLIGVTDASERHDWYLYDGR